MSQHAFPRFLELPRELQAQIWEHALDDTELVTSTWVTDLYLYWPGPPPSMCPLFVGPPLSSIRPVYVYPFDKRALWPILKIMNSSKSGREATYAWWLKRIRSLPSSGNEEFYDCVRQSVVEVLEELLRHMRRNTTQ